MKPIVIILFGVFVFCGCYYDRTENEVFTFNHDINFTISQIIAAGKNVSVMVVLDEKTYFYSVDKTLFLVENGLESTIELPSAILSMAWKKKDQSLWLGTYSSGLVCLKNDQISYFNQKNNNLPRDLIRDVICDNNGDIWFNCSAHLLGGLGRYNGEKLTILTPSNSVLPDNLIKSMACSGEKLYITTGGTVTQQKVVTLENGVWKTLPIQGYYLMDIDVDREGRVYVIDDSGLSSSSLMTNKIYLYDNHDYKDILMEKSRFENTPYILKTDLRNYLWVARFTNPPAGNLAVYDGEKWQDAPESFPESFVNCMAVDQNNTIWLGTKDGIYVLKQ
jgi:ligand-binding sensor domain-containing protein